MRKLSKNEKHIAWIFVDRNYVATLLHNDHVAVFGTARYRDDARERIFDMLQVEALDAWVIVDDADAVAVRTDDRSLQAYCRALAAAVHLFERNNVLLRRVTRSTTQCRLQ